MIVSDPNPKLPLHCDILYKARNINRGDICLVRKYNAALKIDKATNATYTYTSLPEDAAGNMQPTKASAFELKRTLSKTMNLTVDYTTAKQLAQNCETSKLGALVKGAMNKLDAVEVGYSVDLGTQNGQHNDSTAIKLGFDHKLDGDHFITFTTGYQITRGQPDDLSANVDFKTIF